MKWHILLTFLLTEGLEAQAEDRFFITAPSVFHLGVKEKVLVQMEDCPSGKPIRLYLEHEISGSRLSEERTARCAEEGAVQTVELQVDEGKLSLLPKAKRGSYLLLVAQTSGSKARKSTRVFLSEHRGHIFIQTDQPLYNPTQTVKYRIFTLDRGYRPHKNTVHITVQNAAGSKILKELKTSIDGIVRGHFLIPDVSKTGMWKIIAHYDGDQRSQATREFKVQKFVLPSFLVEVKTDASYVLLDAKELKFTISAGYSFGEKVQGSYHSYFGVVGSSRNMATRVNLDIFKGLELTGSVNDGSAVVSLPMARLSAHLASLNQTLPDLERHGANVRFRVFVTDGQSGEVQEKEVLLPLTSHRYRIDLSQTRSHFLPGYPFSVVAFVRHLDGSPAAGVPVKIKVPGSVKEEWQDATNHDGAVTYMFNIQDAAEITIEATADNRKEQKTIARASSPSGSFLYMTLLNKIYSVNEVVRVTFSTLNAPTSGRLYYMVLSRGVLVKTGSYNLGFSVRGDIRVTSDMVPSFRVIGYYYNQGGEIIADSVWIDVRDECQAKVRVEPKGSSRPGKQMDLLLEVPGQRARVAFLVVDKAFYGLHVDNKLTDREVFSSMQNNDLGCSYGGGSNQAAVLTDAGLSFLTHSQSEWRRSVQCETRRQRRSIDLEQELTTLKYNFTDEHLQECCVRGFSVIPMKRTCSERARRVSMVDPVCEEVFLSCCQEGEALREKKRQEDAKKGYARTADISELERFLLDSSVQYTRRFFPESFDFIDFEVNGQKLYKMNLPDSITTWEIQIVTLSAATGFCVVKPTDVNVVKDVFVSLSLPYSVKRYEHLAVTPVIYNFGTDDLQVAIHMEQTRGLCSPGSATTTAFVNITLETESSKAVAFTAVPMVTGLIPIKIRLYDMKRDIGIDAIEKPLNVLGEGLEQWTELGPRLFKLDGKTTETVQLRTALPPNAVPDTSGNVFLSLEGDGFGKSYARNLLNPEKVAAMITFYKGCLEQTMTRLAPTTLAVRYLDLSEQWFDLPTGSRDAALEKIENGFQRIFTGGFKKPDGSYGVWSTVQSSTWVTALVVKVLSLVADRQAVVVGETGREAKALDHNEIRHSVSYLLTVQNSDGSFGDLQPVLHRGVLSRENQVSSMTSFIVLALHRSLLFLDSQSRSEAESSISRATSYLLSNYDALTHPYAVAITAYCLTACQPESSDLSVVWDKLAAIMEGKIDCDEWRSTGNSKSKAEAIAVETAAYALLTAATLGKSDWADNAACWLTTQESYLGGYRSTQDTIMALEALAEYELKRPQRPETSAVAELSTPGRRNIIRLSLENNMEKVETDLKTFVGNDVLMHLSGKGDVKMKLVMAFHVLEPTDACQELSIDVRVEGKVKYTAKIIENYEYYEYEDEEVQSDATLGQVNSHVRKRRDAEDTKPNMMVTYHVCVSRKKSNLTGMAIADITLLSGFVPIVEDLESLKLLPEQYISHYEVSSGKVGLYFNKILEEEECISFNAKQIVPIDLLQPAPATFYDYYEPNRKCTVFYSAPKRNDMVATLCSEEVCQCAERPCHKQQNTFQENRKISKNDRIEHACFYPMADYAYIVEVFNTSQKSNFDMYETKVIDVLKQHGDLQVKVDSVRLFAKRRHCKGQLEVGKVYLIMGKDGTTKDSNGRMQYLLESNTWVERKPSRTDCTKTANRAACKGFRDFEFDYKTNSCRQ